MQYLECGYTHLIASGWNVVYVFYFFVYINFQTFSLYCLLLWFPGTFLADCASVQRANLILSSRQAWACVLDEFPEPYQVAAASLHLTKCVFLFTCNVLWIYNFTVCFFVMVLFQTYSYLTGDVDALLFVHLILTVHLSCWGQMGHYWLSVCSYGSGNWLSFISDGGEELWEA